MDYQEFKQNVIHAIQTELGPQFRVFIQDIIKNNDTHLDGLTILSEQCNISPTLYLNYYYRQYLCGTSLSAICDDILQQYRKNTATTSIDISFFTDFQKVQEHIIFKLINYERNQELLHKVPHFRYLDLAIVFCCLLQSGENSYGTILIHHHHMNLWNITADNLFTLAKKNTPNLLRYDLQSMTDVLISLFDEDGSLSPDDLDASVPMYVLSNHAKINGSCCILYEGLLDTISKQLNSDFYIVPSSIHEVLLIPARIEMKRTDLTKLVREVNATQVLREEVLSDHVYFYSRKKKSISM